MNSYINRQDLNTKSMFFAILKFPISRNEINKFWKKNKFSNVTNITKILQCNTFSHERLDSNTEKRIFEFSI